MRPQVVDEDADFQRTVAARREEQPHGRRLEGRSGGIVIGEEVDQPAGAQLAADDPASLEDDPHAAATPREAAAGADVVISMVTDDEASRGLWLDADTGALGGLQAGALAIESSTLTPGWVRDLAGRMAEREASFLDAPVAGSRPQADAAELIYLVGGADDALERARPLLEAMGGTIHHVGPTGQGALMKLIVNAYFAIQAAAMGEVLGLARQNGLDDTRAADLLAGTPVTSPALRGIIGQMRARSFAPLFPIDLVEKDLRYAVEAAQHAGADAPVAEAARRQYARAQAEGYGGDNIAGVAQVYLASPA